MKDTILSIAAIVMIIVTFFLCNTMHECEVETLNIRIENAILRGENVEARYEAEQYKNLFKQAMDKLEARGNIY